MDPILDGDKIKNEAIDSTLKILREQRDDKQQFRVTGRYDINPQVFTTGNHYIAGPIPFSTPFQIPPTITYGAEAQQAVEQIGPTNPTATGYIPPVIYPYTYGYEQSSGSITAFYIGLYAMTPIPTSSYKFTMNWAAEGKASNYPDQRIDEAWTSAYNKNEAPFLINETGEDDDQI